MGRIGIYEQHDGRIEYSGWHRPTRLPPGQEPTPPPPVEPPPDPDPPVVGDAPARVRAALALFSGASPDDVVTTLDAWTAPLGRRIATVGCNFGKATWSDFTGSAHGLFAAGDRTNFKHAVNVKGWTNIRPAVTLPLAYGPNSGSNWATNRKIMDEVRTGVHDSKYTTVFQRILESGVTTIILRIGHEPDVNYPWTIMYGNHVHYKDCFRRISDMARDFFAGTGVTVLIDYQGDGPFNRSKPNDTVPSSNLTMCELGYPGNDYLDIVGVDVYGTGHKAWDSETSNGNKQKLDYCFSWAISHGKKVSVPEWGVNGDKTGSTVSDTYARDFIVNMYNKFVQWETSNPGSVEYVDYFMGHGGSNLNQKVNGNYVYPLARQKFIDLFKTP